MIAASAPARVGLLGNPSDGYGGKTLGLAVPRFAATVTIEVDEAGPLEIVEHPEDRPQWASVAELVDQVDRFGYGTGPQLLAATVRTLHDVAASVDHQGFDRFGGVISYQTTIPRSVGLGGSSALVVAAIRAIGEALDLQLPPEVLASVALRVETDQLGIAAGLQDRVVQTYGGLMAMNFAESETDARFGVAHGEYRAVDPTNLPRLFVAYREAAAEPSDSYHRSLRHRFDQGDPMVRETMRHLAALAVEGEAALRWGRAERFGRLLTENMELRRRLGPLPEAQLDLVDLAERCDAPASFAGSGGAVVGAVEDDDHLASVCGAMKVIDAVVEPIWPDGDAAGGEDPDGSGDPDDSGEQGDQAGLEESDDSSSVVAFPFEGRD